MVINEVKQTMMQQNSFLCGSKMNTSIANIVMIYTETIYCR